MLNPSEIVDQSPLIPTCMTWDFQVSDHVFQAISNHERSIGDGFVQAKSPRARSLAQAKFWCQTHRRMSWSFLAWCAQVQSKIKMSVSSILVESWGLQLSQKTKSVAHCRGDSKEKIRGDSRCKQNAETSRPNTNKLIKFHPKEDVMLKNL